MKKKLKPKRKLKTNSLFRSCLKYKSRRRLWKKRKLWPIKPKLRSRSKMERARKFPNKMETQKIRMWTHLKCPVLQINRIRNLI